MFDYLVDAEYFHALINKHTGLPEPVHQYVTMEMLRDFGWQQDLLTTDYLNKLNSCLEFYGITDLRSIKLFLATCGHESEKGNKVIENLPIPDNVRYQIYDRGAGYIQITGRDETHLRFLKSVNDSYAALNTAEYIADNYPWEASAWYWAGTSANLKSSIKPTTDTTLNDFIAPLDMMPKQYTL